MKLEKSSFSRSDNENNRYFKMFFYQNSTPMIIVDMANLQILGANEAIITLSGCSDMIGLSITELLYLQDNEGDEISKTSNINNYIDTEDKLIWKLKVFDNHFKYVEINSSEIEFQDHIAMLLSLSDVTKYIISQKELHISLSESRDRNNEFETILNNAPIKMFWKNKDLKYQGANMMFLRDIEHFNFNTVKGLTDYDMPWIKYADAFQKKDLDIIKTGIPQINIEEKFIISKSDILWLKTSRIPLRDKSGNISGILGSFENITKSKKAENALIENENFLHKLLLLFDDALSINNNKELIKFISSQSAYLFNTDYCYVAMWDETRKNSSITNVYGKKIKNSMAIQGDIISFANYVKEEAQIITVENTYESQYTKQLRYIVKNCHSLIGFPIIVNGQYVCSFIFQYEYYQNFTSTYLHHTNIISSNLAILIDRNRTLSDLNENEQLMRSFIEDAPIGILATNKSGKYVMANSYACELYGYSHFEMLNLNALQLISSKFKKISNLGIRKMRFANFGIGDLIAKRKDNSEFWCSSNGVKINEDLYLTFHTDITSRKDAEESLRETLTLEKQLGELKSRFVSMASHEFRTPLATIQAAAESLQAYRRKMTSLQVDERIQKIISQVNHLKNIIYGVLDLSKIREGKIPFSPTASDMLVTIKEVVEDFKSHPRFYHILNLNYDGENLFYYFDHNLIRQIISNLISNAANYSARGTKIDISIKKLKNEIILSVSDHGTGIHKEDMDKLFDPFYRGKNVANTSGSGLGMSIVNEGVKLHGGIIFVKSTVGKGTSVICKLPLK